MRNTKIRIAFIVCAITFTARHVAAASSERPIQASTQAPAPSAGVSGPANSCEIDVPQALIVGNVDAFELQDSFGVTFGYSPTGVKNSINATASVSVSNSSMALTMLAADPISQVDLYSSSVSQDQTNTTINATINFSAFSIKPTAVLNTPLAQVSQSALTQGLEGLFDQLDRLPWIGRVLQMSNGVVVLNAGYLANVHVGDQFTVYNVTNFWAGAPCQSEYENGLRNSKPAGTLTIISVADSTSFATLSDADSSQTILPGAEVRIKALSGKASRELKKKIKIGTIGAKPISISGGTSFDLSTALNSQIKALILNSNYVAD